MLILIIIILSSFFNQILPRTYFSPLPNQECCDPFLRSSKKYYDKEISGRFEIDIMPFYRKASEMFGAINKSEGIATLYHGSNSFEISDLFFDSETPTLNPSNPYLQNMSNIKSIVKIDGIISPNYSFDQAGILIGSEFLPIKNKEWFKIKLKIPISNIKIKQKLGYDSISAIPEENTQIAKDILSGKIKNNYEINWVNYSIFGFGDLFAALNLEKKWLNDKIIGSLFIGTTIPTGLTINEKIKYNYLAIPTGNNGHFMFNAGTELDLTFYKRNKIIVYGSYGYAFPRKETMIATFDGANAFGLQPTFVSNNVSWYQLLFNSDLFLSITEKPYGITIGYQYFLKNNDKIEYENNCIDAVGETHPMSYKKVADFSERQSHSAKISISIPITELINIDFGTSFVFAGEDSLKERIFFLRFLSFF
jgi:hypothetical protein